MKRFLCFFLAAIVLIGCSSCGGQTTTGHSVDFYYRAKEPDYGSGDGIFTVEVRQIDYDPNDYKQIIEDYLRGARIDGCISPFPPGTTLVRLSENTRNISIELSPHMAFQSKADVIVCCACLCKTLFSLAELKTITFSIENHEINGEASITFDKDSFVNWDILS